MSNPAKTQNKLGTVSKVAIIALVSGVVGITSLNGFTFSGLEDLISKAEAQLGPGGGGKGGPGGGPREGRAGPGGEKSGPRGGNGAHQGPRDGSGPAENRQHGQGAQQGGQQGGPGGQRGPGSERGQGGERGPGKERGPRLGLPIDRSSENMRPRLRAADTDQSGDVSRDEFIAYERSRFNSFDGNGDNQLSAEELVSGFIASQNDRPQPGFAEADRDRDGFLSAEETQYVRGPARYNVSTADTDDDGKVSESEFQAMVGQDFASRQLKEIDTNNDGFMSLEEYDAFAGTRYERIKK